MHTLWASAQYHAVITHGGNRYSAPVHLIDSITTVRPPVIDVCMKNKSVPLQADSLFFKREVPDTLFVDYQGDSVTIQNPRLDCITVEINHADVTVISTGKRPFVCMATGRCNDGRLIIDNDTTCTLILSNLHLVSQKANAISFPQKQKAKIVLADGTVNTLSDASAYKTDSTDTSNGCLYAKGSLTFTGNGTLGITGYNRHTISSGKNISLENGHLIIYNTVKDALHCDKMRMDGGTIELNLTTDASKGIKCKGDFIMTGGRIEGEATGNLVIGNRETSYCSLIKSGGDFSMEGGEIIMRHQGEGGRCISVDGNMMMTAGALNLECHGNGGFYLTADNDSDYYTPKCINVDSIARIERGTLKLLATGNGGKGIACSDTLFIGRKGDDFIPEDSLSICVETRGTALVDNIDEDFRKGCPKAIKSDMDIEIHSGNLNIMTHGQGGEGIESKLTLHAYKATIIADTYDDSFNTGVCCHIDGAHVYCLSHNNDGIDSNGSIVISDGIVASVNQSKPNESFDSEDGQFYLLGGTVFGIGSGTVTVKESAFPCYSTPFKESDDGIISRGFILTEGKYVCVQDGEKVIMALLNENKAFRSFITVMSPSLSYPGQYTLNEGTSPENPMQTYFGGKLVLGGKVSSTSTITNIQPTIIN